jgi:hypothetical protein
MYLTTRSTGGGTIHDVRRLQAPGAAALAVLNAHFGAIHERASEGLVSLVKQFWEGLFEERPMAH